MNGDVAIELLSGILNVLLNEHPLPWEVVQNNDLYWVVSSDEHVVAGYRDPITAQDLIHVANVARNK